MRTILQLVALVAIALGAGVVYTLATDHLTFTVPENRYRDALVCRKADAGPTGLPGAGATTTPGTPGTATPGTATPGTRTPGTPGTTTPGTPGTTTPGTSTPGTTTPVAGDPGTGTSPGAGVDGHTPDDGHDHGDGDTPRVELDEAFALWEEGALFVDARRTKEYVKGHVPGSVSISPWESTREERAQALAEKEPKEAPVVVYCTNSEDCHDSKEIAADLKTLDFANVMIFSGGWPEWEKAGKPAATGEEPGARPGF